MAKLTDEEMLAELCAKKAWLRAHPTGSGAAVTKRAVRVLERELEERGVEVGDDSTPGTAGRTTYYVANSPAARSLHVDPGCLHLMDSEVREADESQLRRFSVCSPCG